MDALSAVDTALCALDLTLGLGRQTLHRRRIRGVVVAPDRSHHAQTYTGGTTVNEDVLRLGTGASLAPTGDLTVNAGGKFDLNGNDLTEVLPPL